MNKGLPGLEIPTPKFVSDLVPLPFQKNVLLDPQTSTRWKLGDHGLMRDHNGEIEWEEMARFVNKSYSEVFMESYRYALESEEKAECLKN